jgi:DME family drug/metabolite transporter
MSSGLAAAGAWGLSAVAAANAARRIGVYLALLCSQMLGAVVLGCLAWTGHHPPGGASPLPGLAAAGVLALAGWLTYYMALRRGPLGTVTAVAASYGGIAAILAALTLGERIPPAGTAGITAAVAGVILLARPGQRAGRHARRPHTRPGTQR